MTYDDLSPDKLGQTQNYNTLLDKYGEEYEHWNGVDVSFSGRRYNLTNASTIFAANQAYALTGNVLGACPVWW
jgi:hypothetical protein